MNKCTAPNRLAPRRWELESGPGADPAARSLVFPLDLREWVCTRTLLLLIEEELQKLDWYHPLVLEHLRQNPQYRPKVMLRLLCFAYATGVFGSEEIVHRCQSEAVFRRLCEGRVPFVDELSSFRRRNRKVLERILAQALARTADAWPDRKFDVLSPRGDWPNVLDQAVERLNIARHLDAEGS